MSLLYTQIGFNKVVIIFLMFYQGKIAFNHENEGGDLTSINNLLLHPAGDVLWVFVEPGNVVP